MKTHTKSNVTLMVSNLDESINFYTHTLGMKLKQRYGNHFAEIETPGLTIALHPTEKEIVIGNNTSVGLGVQNFDDEVEQLRLKKLNVNVEKDGPVRLAHFKDMDGNKFYLAELNYA